jgi:hypothetical protein
MRREGALRQAFSGAGGGAAAKAEPGSPGAVPAAAAPAAPAASAEELVGVPIVCNGNRGRFLLQRQACVCACKACAARAARAGAPHLEMTPTEFERHSGARTAQFGSCSAPGNALPPAGEEESSACIAHISHHNMCRSSEGSCWLSIHAGSFGSKFRVVSV